MASFTSPDIRNYTVGKGVGTWTATGGSSVDLGNIPKFEFTPKPEKLEHWSHRVGTRFLDAAVVVAKSGELMVTFDEWTYENLQLALLGSLSGSTNNILDLANFTGQLVFTGTNDVGPKKIWTFPTVILFPTSKIDLISEGYAELEMQGLVTGDPTTGSFGTVADVS